MNNIVIYSRVINKKIRVNTTFRLFWFKFNFIEIALSNNSLRVICYFTENVQFISIVYCRNKNKRLHLNHLFN